MKTQSNPPKGWTIAKAAMVDSFVHSMAGATLTYAQALEVEKRANAYPKVIEALKIALPFVRAEAKAEVDRGEDAFEGYACKREALIMDLLRDLGELPRRLAR